MSEKEPVVVDVIDASPTYRVRGYCSSCDLRIQLRVPRGRHSRSFQGDCPRCGCERSIRSFGEWAGSDGG